MDASDPDTHHTTGTDMNTASTTTLRDLPLGKIALIAAGTWLAWKLLRGLKGLFWSAFGIGMAIYWTGAWTRFT